MVRTPLRFTLLLLLLHIPAILIYPQAGREFSPDEPIKLSTELVVLDVQVLDKKKGQAIGGLRKEDFIVYEDGVKQDIGHFSQDEMPLSIILLLDLSGSVQPYINQIRDGALQALQRLKPEDEVALAAFATSAKIVQDFTTDRKLIVGRIEQINETAHVGKFTFLTEGVYQAAAHLRKASNPVSRRVIIAITDNLTGQFRFIGHSEAEALHELYEVGGTVCGLLVGGKFGKTFRGVQKVVKYHPLSLLLRELTTIESYASKTGGEVLGAGKENMEASLIELIEKLRTRYTLSYTPTNKKRDGKFRRIKVKVSPQAVEREGGLVVLSRRGYTSLRSEVSGNKQ